MKTVVPCKKCHVHPCICDTLLPKDWEAYQWVGDLLNEFSDIDSWKYWLFNYKNTLYFYFFIGNKRFQLPAKFQYRGPSAVSYIGEEGELLYSFDDWKTYDILESSTEKIRLLIDNIVVKETK